jgi:hypothetical protein
MVRKQLYITEAQNAALKRRAQQLGVSEAELTRRALDAVLREETRGEPPRAATKAAQERALDELLENARRISAEHRFPEGYRFDRDALYEDRLTRHAGRTSSE